MNNQNAHMSQLFGKRGGGDEFVIKILKIIKVTVLKGI